MGPWLALASGLLVLAVAVGLIAAHVTVFALDETLIEQSAVHYTSGLPHTLFHDLDARATDRLYSLVLSIALREFAGAQALRIDHVLNVLLFLSTAVPIFLFARAVLRSSWLAVAAALLSVAVPWLTLTSALFTENLSYPLFWWAILAAAAALWRPAPGRDALVLISIALLVATRAQFAALFVGYLLALLLRSFQLAQVRERGADRLRATLTGAARAYPFSLLALTGLVAVVIYEKVSGQWQAHVEELLGSYSDVVTRSGLPANMGEGLLVELNALALGVGLLPAIVSVAWFIRRMAHPQLDRRWVYLAGSGIVIVVFLLLTVYSQGGYLGPITEERYFFYVIPVFWLGMFAAVEDRDVRASDLLLVGVGLALLYASIPFLSSLNQEAAFLDPVESIVPHVLSRRFAEVGLNGLSVQDALAVLAVIAGAFTAWLWSRGRAMRVWWAVGVAVGAQLLLAGYAFAVIDGKITGILGRTAGSVSALGWVDSHVGHSDIAWLDNLSSAEPPTTLASPSADQLRTTLFWNSSVRSWVRLPELGLPPVEVPMAALPGAEVVVESKTGALAPASSVAPLRYLVGATSSPFLQLRGTPLAHSPDGLLTLTRAAQPIRAIWVAHGLRPEGAVVAGSPVRIAAFTDGEPNSGRTGTALAVVLTFVPPASPAGVSNPLRTLLGVRLGEANVRVELAAGGPPVRTRLSTCIPSQAQEATGTIAVRRSAAGAVAGVLQSVTLSRGGACGVRPREHAAERLGGPSK
ncbi:MAG TPA: hypothetical protein VIG42_01220 [Solirubrobacteraceae bacterium]|jgi:hypothetical protein